MKKFLWLIGSLFLTSCTGEEIIDIPLWVIAVGFVIMVIIAGINLNDDKEEKEKSRNQKFDKINTYGSNHIVNGIHNLYYIVVDDKNEQLIIYIPDKNILKEIPFSMVMGVEIIEDNKVLTSKSVGRMVGGALLGGALAGGAGLIVGGLSGKEKKKVKISKIQIKIKLRDFEQPVIIINCFDADRESNGLHKEISSTNSSYKNDIDQAFKDAEKIMTFLSVIIDKNDNKGNQVEERKVIESDVDVIAKIKELNDMKNSGLINDEEYEKLKRKFIEK